MDIKNQSDERVESRYRLRVYIRKNSEKLAKFGYKIELDDNISTDELNRYINKFIGKFKDLLKKYEIDCPRNIGESFIDELKQDDGFKKMSQLDRDFVDSSLLKLAIRSYAGKSIEESSISHDCY